MLLYKSSACSVGVMQELVARFTTSNHGIPFKSAPAISTGDFPARLAPGIYRQKFRTIAKARTVLSALDDSLNVCIIKNLRSKNLIS